MFQNKVKNHYIIIFIPNACVNELWYVKYYLSFKLNWCKLCTIIAREFNVPTTIKLPYTLTDYVKGLALDACIFSHILSKILDFFGWFTKF